MTYHEGFHLNSRQHLQLASQAVSVAVAYFEDTLSAPPSTIFSAGSLSADAFSDSPTPYTCPWKGVAQYHDIVVAGAAHHDAAWSYPDPYPASFGRVGQDYSGYVAFDKRQVRVAA